MGERLPTPPHDITCPPPRALALLAKAHTILHTYTPICSGVDLGAIAACSTMIYGVKRWKLALKNAKLELLDKEEGMVLVDFNVGRGVICDEEVDCVNEDEVDAEDAEEEVKALMAKAVKEITLWDSETEKRVKYVLDI